MGLNRKQKKHLDAARRRLMSLQQQLKGTRAQTDDPSEVPRLESEIAEIEQRIRRILDEGA